MAARSSLYGSAATFSDNSGLQMNCETSILSERKKRIFVDSVAFPAVRPSGTETIPKLISFAYEKRI
jgi:hypothetical protein